MKNSKKSARKRPVVDILLIALAVIGGGVFVIRFAGPQLLRMYIEAGVGTCKDIPILCMVPQEKIIEPALDEEFGAKLLPYEFPRMSIAIPEGFLTIQARVKKIYYKGSMKRRKEKTVVYILYQEPNYFVNLFPAVARDSVLDDFEFMRRTMYATISGIQSVTDAFFVIIKGVFIPDVGDQRKTIMAEFVVGDKRGFINYNLSKVGNFFDCNVFDKYGNYFKIYIKDTDASLDLQKVMTIVSTVRKSAA